MLNLQPRGLKEAATSVWLWVSEGDQCVSVGGKHLYSSVASSSPPEPEQNSIEAKHGNIYLTEMKNTPT